jgi:hypothetical protein
MARTKFGFHRLAVSNHAVTDEHYNDRSEPGGLARLLFPGLSSMRTVGYLTENAVNGTPPVAGPVEPRRSPLTEFFGWPEHTWQAAISPILPAVPPVPERTVAFFAALACFGGPGTADCFLIAGVGKYIVAPWLFRSPGLNFPSYDVCTRILYIHTVVYCTYNDHTSVG